MGVVNSRESERNMAERLWTDPGDGKEWRVYSYNASPALHVRSSAPKTYMGPNMIVFKHPPERSKAEENPSVVTPELLQVDELSDEELCAWLDAAREGGPGDSS